MMKKKSERKNVSRTEQKIVSPKQLHNAHQNAFNYFNKHLFEGKLPKCILNFSRKRNAGGFFSPESWQQNELLQHEISLNPDMIGDDMMFTMSILVHEQAHLFQHCYGKPSNYNYHNKEFSRKMFQIGLICSKTGLPGGKDTGRGMSHYIKEDGAFERVFNQMPKEYLLPFAKAGIIKNSKKRKSKISASNGKLRYVCPFCQMKVWGKQGLSIYCGECKINLINNLK